MKRILFVCSQNRLRSPTAETIFSEYPNLEVLSAGTNHDAETPLSGDLIDWADVIVAMEKTHKNKISKKFKVQLAHKRMVVLDIPDNYEYMQPELVKILKVKLPRVIQF
ncbi:low molecular weight protein tyrosine phosphatase family protein [Candidatus Albibeggiatoa sp. nov. BB20]|uniref:low molecular weight protein tyrosine phosphatase family protein n=1 Tax=Candidatus Albibeggiatoa sp. nov. BB20 TaxID=3162723 RepID=UPI0033658A4E